MDAAGIALRRCGQTKISSFACTTALSTVGFACLPTHCSKFARTRGLLAHLVSLSAQAPDRATWGRQSIFAAIMKSFS
jgi:hypothetical protein